MVIYNKASVRTVLATVFGCLIPAMCRTQTRPQIAAEDIYQRTHGSVVFIVVGDKDSEPFGQGSGFIVAKDRIVTNHHVMQGAREALVFFADGVSEPVDGVVADSPARDLAILAVKTGARAPLILGDELSVRQGNSVYALGAPQGLELSLTNGIVSGFRNVDEQFMIQTTAAMAPGSSGGPLLDSSGRVIGVTTSSFGDSPGIYFSIGASDVKRLLRTPNLVSEPLAVWSQTEGAETKSGIENRSGESKVSSSGGASSVGANSKRPPEIWMDVQDDQIYWIHANRDTKGDAFHLEPVIERVGGFTSCEFRWGASNKVSWLGVCKERRPKDQKTYESAAEITILSWTRIEVRAVNTAKSEMIPVNCTPVERLTTGLYVTSHPSGADIFINGKKEVNRTPAAVPLKGGEYDVVLRLEGYSDYAETVQLTDGHSTQLDVKLLKKASSQ